MSALSGTSYVLPKPRAWDPRRFEESTISETPLTITPGNQTPGKGSAVDLKIQITSINGEETITNDKVEDLTELDLWRWQEGELIKGHPNICPLEDFFEDAGFYYLVLPATKPSFPTMPPGMEDTVEIGDRAPPSDLFDLGMNRAISDIHSMADLTRSRVIPLWPPRSARQKLSRSDRRCA